MNVLTNIGVELWKKTRLLTIVNNKISDETCQVSLMMSLIFMVLIKIFGLLLLLTGCQNTQDNSSRESEVRLIWAEEFNEDGAPSPENWDYEHGFVRNNELQWYQPGNARVENGILIIEGKREQVENPKYNPESDDGRQNREFAEYTSTSMHTRGLHSWQFGRFEMRARIDTRDGLWPAWWTLGVEGQWPHNGEIDIMEYYGGVLLANAAWGTDEQWIPEWDDSRTPVPDLGEDWAEEFHVWRMDWTEEYIRIYMNDLLLNEVDLSETINPEGKNPFHQPHYMLINLTIGGTQGGDPSGTAFPARYEIDYIRVYEWLE